MFDWYWHLRLWYWWNYVIKRDEFSTKLGYLNMYNKYKNSYNYLVDVLNATISRQRNIAHMLDDGKAITDISPHYIMWACI